MDYKEFEQLLITLPCVIQENGEEFALSMVAKVFNNLTIDRNKLTKNEDLAEMNVFRNKYLPRILQSEFPYSVFTKPRGYPGDYLTQEMIWRSKTGKYEDKYRGNSETGKCFNAMTLLMDNCKANLERYNIISSYLHSKYESIASIGCGSGIEYWDCNYKNINSLFFLDQDDLALNSVKNNIFPQNKSKNIIFHKCNILRFVLSEKNLETMGARDLIYSLGLFDYFDINSSMKIICKLWKFVKKGGTLLISNAHPDNPTKLWMEWGGDWFLTYKSKDEMHQLYRDLKDIQSVNLTTDSQGVYQYLEIIKS